MSGENIKEFIFNGNDNSFTIEYTLADFNFALINKVEFELDGTAFNSPNDAAFFDITTGPLTVGTGQFVFKFGAAGYAAGLRSNATITLFDPSTPNGLVFSSPEGPTKVAIVVV